MLQAAEDRYRQAARLAALMAVSAGRAWDEVPLSDLDAWRPESLAVQVTAAQIALARGSDAYVVDVLAEQGLSPDGLGRVEARAFGGLAGDGRPLVTLFDEVRIRAKELIGEGVGARDAWHRARNSLRLMVVTAVQDAGRGADSVAMVARPAAGGYVRMLNLPSCSRCVILAGKFYRWNQGFQRHPRCDCRHVPSSEDIAGDLTVSPMGAFRAGQVTGLSRADVQALEDGADISQVVNARRGMTTADVFGRRLKITSEGITKRGFAASRLRNFETNVARSEGQRYRRSRTPRLMPESIYAIAKDREDALRLLRRFGYLI